MVPCSLEQVLASYGAYNILPSFLWWKKIGKFAKYPTSHHLPQKNYYADSALGLLVYQTRKVTLTKKPCFACVQINSGLAHFLHRVTGPALHKHAYSRTCVRQMFNFNAESTGIKKNAYP